MATNDKFTRGKGVLEPLLARLRAERANRLIPRSLRNGRILDIGCGTFPYFLSTTAFAQKFAVDQFVPAEGSGLRHQIEWHTINLNKEPVLPFKNNYFSVVTLLAVVEHLDPTSMAALFKETHRVLTTDGMVILTTPAAWSDGLLRFMSRVNLVSAEEINEHAFAYTLPLIGWYFGQAGYEMRKVRFGYFEFMLNLWATAIK